MNKNGNASCPGKLGGFFKWLAVCSMVTGFSGASAEVFLGSGEAAITERGPHLSAPRPFTGIPFAITGTVEAEQFDLGGPGVAYSNSVDGGLICEEHCTSALLLKNNFGVASNRALDHRASSASARSFHILKNVLNQGKSYHLKVAYQDSSFFFLQKNVYTNGVTSVDPFFDAAASPVHIMR